MIKKPFNFVVGIFCGIGFIIDILLGRDLFVLLVTAFASVSNIIIGLYWSEYKE